jgi:DNA-binding transcriptional LysR family regulator
MKEFPSHGAKLHDYETFIAIIDTGNLTRAAARLRRSLQSVSRSLSALEQQLGVELVRRTTRQARPTEAGMAFYRRIAAALSDIAAAETELRDMSGTLVGSLCIAASAFFAARYLVPAIREFNALHPAVEFDLRISEAFTEPVRTGADIMIRVGHLPASPLKARKITALRRVVVAAPTYIAQRGRPERPADLATHACLVRSTAQDARTWTFHGPDGDAERVSIAGKFVCDNAYVVNHAVLAGMGVAVVPYFHVREAVESGLAEVLLGDYTLPQTPVHALWRAATRTPTRVHRFVDLLAQRLKKEVT